MSDTPDALLLLRECVAASLPVGLMPTDSLDTATELSFPPAPPLTTSAVAIPLSTLTRFIKDSNAVDLRSIYFAWQERDTPITDYIASAQALGVTHLAFIERLELVTYLEGGQEESDHIRPLPATSAPVPSGDANAVAASTSTAASTKTPSSSQVAAATSLAGKVRQTDPRLMDIYSYERVLNNRNIMLRGIKATVPLSPYYTELAC